MSEERLSSSCGFAELKAAMLGVRDEVIENRRRMEELWMADLVRSFKEQNITLAAEGPNATRVSALQCSYCYFNVLGIK